MMGGPEDRRSVPSGDGEMARLIRAFPWSGTPLGPIGSWPQHLRTTLDLCLANPFPTMIVWGPSHVQLYNDALLPLMGSKHPGALGRSYAETFCEIWHVQGPMLAALHERGEPSYQADLPVRFERNGMLEEMYFTFSWSPIRSGSGEIDGALHVVHETTRQVIGERRLGLLRAVAAGVSGAETAVAAAVKAMDLLAGHPDDVPFALLRLADGGDVSEIAAGTPPAGLSDGVWPLADGRTGAADDLLGADAAQTVLSLADGPPGARVVALPLPRWRSDDLRGALLAGVSPHLPLDDAYLDFFDVLAAQVATRCNSAAAFDAQRRVALSLQESLLPRVEAADGLEVAARYRPGEAVAKVGGDWFDVLPLEGGRTALVIGDVMGRGLHAAALMGQLRAAVRAYAQLDLEPEDILRQLDRLVEHIADDEDATIVTCVYAVFSPATGDVAYASAGHPPPIVVGASGPCGRPVDMTAAAPLGVGGTVFECHHVTLSPGDTLVLYTDGIVEKRTEDIDVSIERFARLAGEVVGPLEAMCDTLLRISAESTGGDDDAALLLVRPV
jgi:hypothetical protein